MSSRNDKRKELFGTLPIEDQNFIAKYGWEMWKKKEKVRLETEIEEEEQEIEETTDKEISKLERTVQIPDACDIDDFMQVWETVVAMCLAVQTLKVHHGVLWMIKKENGGISVKVHGETVSPPEQSDEEIEAEMQKNDKKMRESE